jgi:hypothetical protein
MFRPNWPSLSVQSRFAPVFTRRYCLRFSLIVSCSHARVRFVPVISCMGAKCGSCFYPFVLDVTVFGSRIYSRSVVR